MLIQPKKPKIWQLGMTYIDLRHFRTIWVEPHTVFNENWSMLHVINITLLELENSRVKVYKYVFLNIVGSFGFLTVLGHFESEFKQVTCIYLMYNKLYEVFIDGYGEEFSTWSLRGTFNFVTERNFEVVTKRNFWLGLLEEFSAWSLRGNLNLVTEGIFI